MAILRPPSDFIIMASATEFSIYDVRHQYIVGSSTHCESDFGVAYIAFEPNAMKPVRKDNRTHSGFFRSLIEHHISVFSVGWRQNK